MLRNLIACVCMLVLSSCASRVMDKDTPCGNARYNQLLTQSVRTAAEQHEFDSLDKECNRYLDSLEAQKSTGEKALNVTAIILLAVVVAIIWLGQTLGHSRVG